MDRLSRRAFCAAATGLAAGLSGCSAMSQDTTTQGSRAPDDGTVVATREGLEAAFDDLEPGDTIRISGENAPYRTTEWLDVDVDGVTVVGPGVQRLVEPADGANVGGIRIGHDSRCHEVDIRGVGYYGNPEGQGNADRLHGVSVEDATNVTISQCLIRGTYPRAHGNGGSGISVTRNCSDVRIYDTKIDRFGDRGIQLAGERHMVYGNVITNGLDRPIACDLWPSSDENPAAQSVSVFGNLLGNSVEGSLVGVARNSSSEAGEGYLNVVGNVGFGSHKSFCHVRGPEALRNISVQNNVSVQETDLLDTEQTTQFAGVAVDVAECEHLAVKNNELYGYSGYGVHVNSEVRDVAVQHNGVFDAGRSGIRLVDAARGIVDGNLITSADGAGIRLKGASEIAVRGNYVRDVADAGIATGGAEPPAGHDIADNYVAGNNRGSGDPVPAILVREGGVRVRDNTVRQNGAAAIAEPASVEGNVYEGNWADGDDPWLFASPASRVRNNTPPTGVHRGAGGGSEGSTSSGGSEATTSDDGSDDGVVRVEFDRAYARRPRLTFGRNGGGVGAVSYLTDDDGNYVGAEVATEGDGAPLDVFVDGA